MTRILLEPWVPALVPGGEPTRRIDLPCGHSILVPANGSIHGVPVAVEEHRRVCADASPPTAIRDRRVALQLRADPRPITRGVDPRRAAWAMSRRGSRTSPEDAAESMPSTDLSLR